MRFKLTLVPLSTNMHVPFNYQYALSAVIYKKLAQADEDYASFLHQKGYAQNDHFKHFKLFSYSNLLGDFKADKNALQLKGNETGFVLGCHTPEFAENLIKGVFANQRISIGDKTAQADFEVQQISAEADISYTGNQKRTLKLLSPLAVGKKNDRGNYDYLSPVDTDFLPILKNNLFDKLLTAYPDKAFGFDIGVNLFPGKLKSRLVSIKAGTPEETKVKGFMGFSINIKAEAAVVNMALCGGLGQYNGVGFGAVGIK
ncbi:MAG: CRISPR-associated endoribonuclease Cas6 [Sphingobacteriaceae bacterium]